MFNFNNKLFNIVTICSQKIKKENKWVSKFICKNRI